MKNKEKLQAILDILSKRNLYLKNLLFEAKNIYELNKEIRESIIDELCSELVEHGLIDDNEPNNYGLIIEDLIDFCDVTKE